MAASSPPRTPTPADTIHGSTDDSRAGSSSFFRKTVCLFDWWLIKTENAFQGKRLGIAGLTSREQNQALRVFSSSAIAKRFDVFTLETSDGVSIVIKGFINKQRTSNNGFPSEVFHDFVFGFPPNWEKYAEQYCTIEDSSAVSAVENPSSTIQSSLEESPKKNGHAIHEDSKEVEVSEYQSQKVSENIVIHSSQVSNLNSQHAVEKRDQMNVAPNGGRRCVERLRKLKGNQENPESSCSLKDGTNVSPTLEATTVAVDDEKLNSSLGGTIQSGRKLDVSEKYPIHLSAKIRSKTKEKPTIVFGLANRNNMLNPLPVSDPKNNLVQNEVRSGSILISSGNELDEPMGVNVTEKLGDGSVKDGPHQTSNSKRRRKPENVNSKAAKETEAEEESTPCKKSKRKIMFEKQVPPHSPEEKAITSIFSPECSTYGRSRSGRLLLPAMEFWRNQMPVYDSDRNITGILGDLPVLVSPGGSRSMPRKKQNKCKGRLNINMNRRYA